MNRAGIIFRSFDEKNVVHVDLDCVTTFNHAKKCANVIAVQLSLDRGAPYYAATVTMESGNEKGCVHVSRNPFQIMDGVKNYNKTKNFAEMLGGNSFENV